VFHAVILQPLLYKSYHLIKLINILLYGFIMARISASILSFYFDSKERKEPVDKMILHINKALKDREQEYDILHLDIEDGKFVKTKSFTPSMIRKIHCSKKKEAHFMVLNYKKYLKDYFTLADMFIFHHEILKRDFPKTIEFLHKNKKYVGIAVNSETHVDELKYLDKVDLVLVMGIHTGLPGQKFMENTLWKIRKLKDLRDKENLKFVIEVDGGINHDNMQKVIDAGADILEMGSGLFK